MFCIIQQGSGCVAIPTGRRGVLKLPRGCRLKAQKAVMSDEKPDLGDLAIELDELTWAEVMKMALRLKVQYSELKKIEEKNSEPNPRLLAAMDLWLTTDSGATWGRVVKALRDIKKAVLAQELEEKHCKKPADSPSKDSAATATSQPTTASSTSSGLL